MKITEHKQNETQPACTAAARCGGCTLLHMPYEKQLEKKLRYATDMLGKFVKPACIIGMENPYRYRNKVHAVIAPDKRTWAVSGIYEAGTHRVVPIDSCLIENAKADEIIVTVREMMRTFKMRAYNEDTGDGFLRHVLVRTGHASGEIMLVLVTADIPFVSKNNFIRELLKRQPEISTIVQNINNRRTSVVLGDKETVLYGRGFIEDTLCGKIFRISPKSFYQINSVQTEKLYATALEMAQLSGNETVIDAYCGIGTIGIAAAEHAGKVIGVELNKDAVRDAITNSKRNNTKNIRFYCADAGEFMRAMAAEGEKADVIFMDPPRSGSDEKFLKSVAALHPNRVVYISCNPETCARDIGYLVKNGYAAERAAACDMFPMTEHVETVVALSRVRS